MTGLETSAWGLHTWCHMATVLRDSARTDVRSTAGSRPADLLQYARMTVEAASSPVTHVPPCLCTCPGAGLIPRTGGAEEGEEGRRFRRRSARGLTLCKDYGKGQDGAGRGGRFGCDIRGKLCGNAYNGLDANTTGEEDQRGWRCRFPGTLTVCSNVHATGDDNGERRRSGTTVCTKLCENADDTRRGGETGCEGSARRGEGKDEHRDDQGDDGGVDSGRVRWRWMRVSGCRGLRCNHSGGTNVARPLRTRNTCDHSPDIESRSSCRPHFGCVTRCPSPTAWCEESQAGQGLCASTYLVMHGSSGMPTCGCAVAHCSAGQISPPAGCQRDHAGEERRRPIEDGRYGGGCGRGRGGGKDSTSSSSGLPFLTSPRPPLALPRTTAVVPFGSTA